MLVKINDYDITPHILSGYNVNETPYYKQKRDGFGKKHRELIRSEVAGNFEMKLATEEEYQDFVDLLNESKDEEGRIPMEVYINNANRTKHGLFFLGYSARLDKDLDTGKRFRKFTVSIEEA